MANLHRSTTAADSAVDGCQCEKDCEPRCSRYGEWHNHSDDVCPIHPDTIVDV